MRPLIFIISFALVAAASVSENKKHHESMEESFSKLQGFTAYKSRVDGIRRAYNQ